MTPAPFLEVKKASVAYGATTVLEGIDLAIAKGEFVALLGSSGCGKTTLLRTIAGFVKPVAGTISVAGRDVTRLPPDKRGMALVFQSYALWPHMTVAQNIGYGLKLRRQPADAIARRVAEMEALLGLTGLSRRKPAQLSGGQRQRVALGRALAIDPEILLLDEPLSNLDARIRLSVRHEIRALQRRLGITAVHVTHDREEAMVMADRIVILDGGRIAQAGTPEEVYNRPVSSFVAAFMGAENCVSLAGRVTGGHFAIAAGPTNAPCTVPLAGRPLVDGPVVARFRAEAATLVPADDASAKPEGTLVLSGRVESASYPGGHWRHAVVVGPDTVLVDAPAAFAPNTAVKVCVPPQALFLFSPAGAETAKAGPSAYKSNKASELAGA
ncbi:ABC transporter ATP-binding protein [Chelatococcus composti]|jgi:ABC-type spermidine/putrescine transport systems, ATPase components|uniref:ABC-type Fe3+/spermidine/putrescine transport system ATPase subunit n=1 Tax=Chelatococcus composti TaxID=1743235 RepID=A0A841KFD9_9HYPH|nr:ABC transporter ATP-binding protein [Chelatococcus composti]MBB6168646.1 ABC-type Fe3+/spermidine/putrescine transport system ATPase subunit [Chelatococcus composti]MBS7737256.1 ABC transporter ATP-binding protein [Chelatococcus composti]GGG41639.1 polyamine-transporting ATPase [Chelatococcus composti]